MRIFHCDHCRQLVFFENVQCLTCKHTLAYLPDVSEVGSLEKADDDLWKAFAPEAAGRNTAYAGITASRTSVIGRCRPRTRTRTAFRVA